MMSLTYLIVWLVKYGSFEHCVVQGQRTLQLGLLQALGTVDPHKQRPVIVRLTRPGVRVFHWWADHRWS